MSLNIDSLQPPEADSLLDEDSGHVHDNAAHRVGVAILSGRYGPGDKLPTEIESAERFGISRSSYREATRILAAKGMLVSRPKVGTAVTPRTAWNLLDPDVLAWAFQAGPTPDYVNDLFELRMLVEPSAASLAATRRSEAQLATMAECLDIMRRETLATEEGQAADRLFHSTILEATGNAVLVFMSNGIGAAARWATAFKQRNRALPRDPIPDHARVLDAIRNSNPEAARAAAITLLLLAHEDTKQSME